MRRDRGRGRSGWAGIGLATGILLLAATTADAGAQVRVGVVVDRDGLRAFHLAIGQVYGVPARTVSRYAPDWLRPDELPVVHLLAGEARVSPEVVIALRERGWSWLDITVHLGISPRIFVAHLPARVGPPYGKAHGYWRKRGRDWRRGLTDRQIVDYVNVHLWAEYHRRPVAEVIVARERYDDWMPVARRAPSTPSRQVAPAPGRGAVERASPAPTRGRKGPPPGRGRGRGKGGHR